MKLSKREQVMLAGLLIVALLASAYYLIYQPMKSDYDELDVKRQKLQVQYDTTMAAIDQLVKSTENANNLSTEISKKTERYYPSIIQEQLVLVMNQIYDESLIIVRSETFTLGQQYEIAPASTSAQNDIPASQDLKQIASDYKDLINGKSEVSEATSDQQQTSGEDINKESMDAIRSIEKMDMNIQFSATYIQMMDFVQRVEALNRSIQVKQLDISVSKPVDQTVTGPAGETIAVAAPNGQLDFNIDLVFNAIPKLTAQDDAYEAWTLTGTYGKVDPFIK